ncbi:MAG: hypothetical protein H5U08_14615, partial [Thermogutta sp.]|uniref:hypothetical protein n=1 Tax=Thermogutta sp. TaxID=1962930 RepID=UPI0019A383B9
MRLWRTWLFVTCVAVATVGSSRHVAAGSFTLRIKGAPPLRLVGVIQRWDQDGNPVKPVDPKAKIDAPDCIPAKQTAEGVWQVEKLAPGRY